MNIWAPGTYLDRSGLKNDAERKWNFSIWSIERPKQPISVFSQVHCRPVSEPSFKARGGVQIRAYIVCVCISRVHMPSAHEKIMDDMPKHMERDTIWLSKKHIERVEMNVPMGF